MSSNEDNEARKKADIRRLNDQLRMEANGNGTVVITQGIQALGETVMAKVIRAIQSFDDFSTGNDPHDEHDFGVVDIEGNRVLWKIDYYDLACQAHSPDAADESVTHRVLSVMLSSEY